MNSVVLFGMICGASWGKDMGHLQPVSHKGGAALMSGSKTRAVYLALRDRIDRGDLDVGAVLPGEQRLAAEFDVSRVTVRRALAALSEDGLVVRHVGRGSVVQPHAAAGRLTGDLRTLMPQLYELAEKTEVKLLSCHYTQPSARLRQQMALHDGQRVQLATRLRLSQGQPYSHLTSYVPDDIARSYSEQDLATMPLFQLIERSGMKIASAEQSVSATLAAPEVAALLEVAPGAALMTLDRVVRDVSGRVVEVLSALYRPDRFRLSMQLNRVGGESDRHWEPIFGYDTDGDHAP